MCLDEPSRSKKTLSFPVFKTTHTHDCNYVAWRSISSAVILENTDQVQIWWTGHFNPNQSKPRVSRKNKKHNLTIVELKLIPKSHWTRCNESLHTRVELRESHVIRGIPSRKLHAGRVEMGHKIKMVFSYRGSLFHDNRRHESTKGRELHVLQDSCCGFSCPAMELRQPSVSPDDRLA